MSKTDGMTFLQKVDYYWYYYKWHALVIVCLLIALTATVVSCVNKVEPDLRVLLVSDVAIGEEDKQTFIKTYSQFIEDVNDDGKKHMTISLIQFSNFTSSTMNPELESASEVKLRAELMSGDAQLIIFKDNITEYLEGFGTFADLSKYDNDKGYFTLDDDDKQLLDLTSGDYHVCVRVTSAKATEEQGEALKMYDNAYTVLENMIKQATIALNTGG